MNDDLEGHMAKKATGEHSANQTIMVRREDNQYTDEK